MDKTEVISMPASLFLGLGGSGEKVVTTLRKQHPEIKTAVIDTDERSLQEHSKESCVLLGNALTGGMSAGGDDELGRQAAEKSDASLRALFKGYDFIFLVAGLGGGTASGSLPVLARIAKQMGIRLLIMVTRPFPFEGDR